MPDGSAYKTGSHVSDPGGPECSAIFGQQRKSSWGGARPGAGRPRKPETPAPVDSPAWRVYATFGQAEISATRELARQGYETYLPMIAIRRRDRVTPTLWHDVQVPMCRGYGFIRLTQGETREPILLTRGIRELLHHPSGRLWTVPERDIERLRDGDAERLRLPKTHGSVLAVRTVVRIENGPFTGSPGVVLDCDGLRTCVEAQMFGRGCPVWLDRADVELVV